jgi:hypothetical protein
VIRLGQLSKSGGRFRRLQQVFGQLIAPDFSRLAEKIAGPVASRLSGFGEER